MEFLLFLLASLLGLAVFDSLALTFGVDSRMGFADPRAPLFGAGFGAGSGAR
ncbi:MAG TPA: hypothetical protein VLH81_14480 [Desulfobacterales bacterium]|nr:hypothetical protein [Desulfobacterales bacterium]